MVTIENDSVNNTGSIVQNIPLYTINVGNYSFPIQLTYSSSGIKIEEIPSWVGTGWNLSAGGVITRSVLDYPDDLNTGVHGKGILHSNLLSKIKTFEQSIATNGFNHTAAQNFLFDQVYDDALKKHNDTEPDIFYFNVFGIQGKFIFDENKKIKSLSNKNYKFSYTLDANGRINSFSIIDNRGITYNFEEKETSKTHFFSGRAYDFLNNLSRRQLELEYHSSWHLTKVTLPTSQQITFEYHTENILYSLHNAEMAKVCYTGQCEDDPNVTNEDKYDFTNFSRFSKTSYQITSKKIKKISYSDVTILFGANNREDLNGGKKLSNITVKYKTNQIFKYDFLYTYFISPNMPTTNNYEYKRLKLTTIVKNGEALRTFDYYENVALPHRKSPEQDYWGYYNANNANSLIPKTYLVKKSDGKAAYHIFPPKSGYFMTMGAVDRTPNPSVTHMGMLKKITYRTKGYKEFFYEPNNFRHNDYVELATEKKLGAGVRLQKIRYSNGESFTKDRVYNYNYENTNTTSGKIFHLPKFASHIPWLFTYSTDGGFRVTVANPRQNVSVNYERSQRLNPQTNSWESYWCYIFYANGIKQWSPTNHPLNYYGTTTRRFSTSVLPLASNTNNSVIYENISVKEGSLNGKELFEYHVDGALGMPNTSTIPHNLLHNRTSYATAFKHPVYYPQIQQAECHQQPWGMGIQFYNYVHYLNLDGTEFPYAPKPNWNRYSGLLKKYSVKDNNNTTVYEELYDYAMKGDLQNASNKKNVIALKYRLFDRPVGYFVNWSPHNYNGETLHPSLWVLSFYDVYVGMGAKPTKKTIINHYGTNQITKQISYTYRHGNILYRKQETGSDGEEKITETTIIDDYSFPNGNPQATVFKILKTYRNILAPIEKLTYIKRNNVEKLIGANITFFKNFNGLALPSQEYNLEIKQPITNYIPVKFLGTTTMDSRLKPTISYDDYDASGNLLQFHNHKGTTYKNIWGYNNTRLIAQIKNRNTATLNWAQQNAIIEAQNVSNNETTAATENQLRAKLKNFQNTFSNAQVSTYTYDPLIGVKSITDIGGNTSYFTYDNEHRLQYLKNKDKQVLEAYKYHYKLEEVVATTTSSSTTVVNGQSLTLTTNVTGGTGNFAYKWIVSNTHLNQTYNTSTNTLTITATTDYAPNFTVKCIVTDPQTGTVVNTLTHINVTISYAALSASNITYTSGSNYIGKNVQHTIHITGGSGNYKYNWVKSNNQSSTNLGSVVTSSSTNSKSARIISSDCSFYTIRCEVKDLTTNEVIIKTARLYVSGCSGGGGNPRQTNQ